MLDTAIRPSDIDTTRGFRGNYFEPPEERAARQVTRFLQTHGNDWTPFDYDEFDAWLVQSGYPTPEHGRLGWLTDALLLYDAGLVHITPEFITRCFLGGGKLHRKGPPNLDTPFGTMASTAAEHFSWATAEALRNLLEGFGCTAVSIIRPEERVLLQMRDGNERPFTVRLTVIEGGARDPMFLDASLFWVDGQTDGAVSSETAMTPNSTPNDAASNLLSDLKREIAQTFPGIRGLQGDEPRKGGC